MALDYNINQVLFYQIHFASVTSISSMGCGLTYSQPHNGLLLQDRFKYFNIQIRFLPSVDTIITDGTDTCCANDGNSNSNTYATITIIINKVNQLPICSSERLILVSTDSDSISSTLLKMMEILVLLFSTDNYLYFSTINEELVTFYMNHSSIPFKSIQPLIHIQWKPDIESQMSYLKVKPLFPSKVNFWMVMQFLQKNLLVKLLIRILSSNQIISPHPIQSVTLLFPKDLKSDSETVCSSVEENNVLKTHTNH
ncbi:hypothetical protein ACTA71_001743 [Dictyostelium dimigraforme]